jgi:hypothetical protein
MVVESAIHNAKGIAAKFRVFKRPRIGETRFHAGVRRILEHSWLNYDLEREIAQREIPCLPSQTGDVQKNKFTRLYTVSEGDEKFGMKSSEEMKENNVIQANRGALPPAARNDPEAFIEVVSAPPPPLTKEEREHRNRVIMWGRMTSDQLKIELRDRSLKVGGSKAILLGRLVSFYE